MCASDESLVSHKHIVTSGTVISSTLFACHGDGTSWAHQKSFACDCFKHCFDLFIG
jgi:hypothetical protein